MTQIQSIFWDGPARGTDNPFVLALALGVPLIGALVWIRFASKNGRRPEWKLGVVLGAVCCIGCAAALYPLLYETLTSGKISCLGKACSRDIVKMNVEPFAFWTSYISLALFEMLSLMFGMLFLRTLWLWNSF